MKKNLTYLLFLMAFYEFIQIFLNLFYALFF